MDCLNILRPYIKRNVLLYIFAVFFILVNSLLALLVPYLTMKIIDVGIGEADAAKLVILTIASLLISILYALTNSLQSVLYAKIGKKISRELRRDCINKLNHLSGDFYTHIDSGDVLSILLADIRKTEFITTTMLLSFVSNVVVSIAMLIWLGILQLDLLAVSLTFQLLTFFVQFIYKKKLSIASEELRTASIAMSSLLLDRISNMLTQTISKVTPFFMQRYTHVDGRLYKSEMKMTSTQSLNMALLNIASGIVTIVILGVGGYKVVSGTLSLGGLISFNIYSQRLFGPVTQIAELYSEYCTAKVSLKNIVDLLSYEDNVSEPSIPVSISDLKGKIDFKNVSFSYDESKVILQNASFTIPSGGIYSLIGSSGAGKTTLIFLLYRLWEVNSGAIYIDDINIRDIPLDQLRNEICVVSQDAYLFNDTLRNNIILGDSHIDDSSVMQYLKTVGLDRWVATLNDGLDTLIGEDGIRLSGGQRQRISLVRALIQKSKIVLLDEITSALDQRTEAFVLSGILPLLKGKTVIIISHKTTTIGWTEKSIVIEDGNVHIEEVKQ